MPLVIKNTHDLPTLERYLGDARFSRPMNPADSPFLSLLKSRVMLFDGAMGTQIHLANLTMADYENQENFNEVLNLTRPELIENIHLEYLKAGSDAVETNSFNANKLDLIEFNAAHRTHQLNHAAAQVARRACDRMSTPDRPRCAVGSLGPGRKSLTWGNVDYETILDSYAEQARGHRHGRSPTIPAGLA